MTERKSELVIAEKLLKNNRKLEEYDISDRFAIYRGATVDYKLIKLAFQLRVEEAVINSQTTLTSITTLATTTTTSLPSAPTITVTSPSATEKTLRVSQDGEEEEESKTDTKQEEKLYEVLSSKIKDERTVEEAKNIAIFFNINGTSKTRLNVLYINKKAYTMNEIAILLQLRDKTTTDREKTDRRELTVERIASAYCEETANFLKKNKKFIKIKNLDYLGFTKSFFFVKK